MPPTFFTPLDKPERINCSEQTPVLITSEGGANSGAHKDVVVNHQASGASSVKKQKLRSSGGFYSSKKYFVKFEGNSSIKCDGKNHHT